MFTIPHVKDMEKHVDDKKIDQLSKSNYKLLDFVINLSFFNKNYYCSKKRRMRTCARSRYALKLSLIFVYLEWLIRH